MNLILPELLKERPANADVVLSASQLDLFGNQCERKWAFKYIAKLPTPQHPSAKLGSDVHTVLEYWLKHAVPPPINDPFYGRAARIAARMIPHLPAPGTGQVENRNIHLRSRWGHVYVVIIDWIGIFQGWPTIIDHKTTGDFQYAKTQTSLHWDVQAQLYALAGFLGFGVDELLLFWDYACTKGRDAETKPVKTRVSLPVVLEKFEQVIEPTAAQMIAHRRAATPPMSFPMMFASAFSISAQPVVSVVSPIQPQRLSWSRW